MKPWTRTTLLCCVLSLAATAVVRAQPAGEAAGAKAAAGEPARAAGALASGAVAVTAHGALCDGASDDTAAIQAALDAAGQMEGARLLLPNRECRVSRPLRVPTATTITGGGRRSKLSASAPMEALLVFREPKAAGFFGGLEDLHLDCRKQARFAVELDSWRAARFESLEINNCLHSGFHVAANESDDSAFHVFDQVWVRDDVSTAPVGSRFALLEAGASGKVTDCTFRDCVVTQTTPFQGSPVFAWELRDTTRIKMYGCRISSVVPWDASVAITQTAQPSHGAVVRDVSSGWNIVRDFYHEQQQTRGAVGVVIDAARSAAGQFQRDNVVENINMQPTQTTAVWIKSSGAAGNALGNRVFLPQRSAVSPRTVVIEKGAVQTRVWIHGGDQPLSVGPEDDRIVVDRGQRTWVNGIVGFPSLDNPEETPSGANLGDVVWDSGGNRAYLVTPGGLVALGSRP